MNKKGSTISVAAGIALMLLLIGGTGSYTYLFNTGSAQSETLGDPIFVEKGGDTVKREQGPNRTEYTFTSSGILNDNIEYNKKGEYMSVSKGNNVTFDQGKGVISTKDGSESANYTFIEVGNGTDYHGASVYSTNSTGKLSFLNNVVVIFKGGYDENGNYALKQWHWK
jgi:hypothetical protein